MMLPAGDGGLEGGLHRVVNTVVMVEPRLLHGGAGRGHSGASRGRRGAPRSGRRAGPPTLLLPERGVLKQGFDLLELAAVICG